MNLLGYTRVSTVEQASDGYGLASQQAQIEQAARSGGWTLADVLCDEGESAKTLDRPALQLALHRIADRHANGLVVAKLDRLTRSVIDFATLLEWFGRAGATLIALDLQVDTSSPGGRLVANVFACVAEWERDMIAQRTRDGLAAARAKGLPTGRPAVSDRPELRELIVALRDAGWSYRRICEHLNAEGVPTARGARVWRPSSVQGALGYRRAAKRPTVALPRV